LLPENAPTGVGVRVAILDTGVDLHHPDLRGRVCVGDSASFTTKDDIADRNGHGSHIAGIIGGSGAASNGYFRGLAPDCDLIALKISETRTAPEWNAIAAVERAIELRVDIINYSHGYAPTDKGEAPWLWPEYLNALEDVFNIADANGILCVVAAGNRGPAEGSVTRPGGLESVLTVGAIDGNAQLLPHSGRGPFRRSRDLRPGGARRYNAEPSSTLTVIAKPDVVAPGEINGPRSGLGVFDDDPETADPHYISMSGTSQATAVVSGLAALILENMKPHTALLGPNRTRTLRRLFCNAARKLKFHRDEDAGHGQLLWPVLASTFVDFIKDPAFRDAILGEPLRLL